MAESYYAKQYEARASAAKKTLMNLTFPAINFNKKPIYPLKRSSFPCCLERYFLLIVGSGTVPGAEIGNYFLHRVSNQPQLQIQAGARLTRSCRMIYFLHNKMKQMKTSPGFLRAPARTRWLLISVNNPAERRAARGFLSVSGTQWMLAVRSSAAPRQPSLYYAAETPK